MSNDTAVLLAGPCKQQREREMFYLTTHSTHFIYGYMASDIWLRTILIVRKETRCRHIGYSYRFTARVLLYAPSHRQDNTYHGLCYTSRGALAGTRNSSMGPPHEGSIRRPTATMSERSTSELHPAPLIEESSCGLSDRSFMVDPLSNFSFQPVLHDWCNKGCGMCYHVCWMVHIKEPLLLIGKSSPCGGSRFLLSLSEWSFTICPTPINRK